MVDINVFVPHFSQVGYASLWTALFVYVINPEQINEFSLNLF
jgi:hypothetical protein